MTTYNTGNPIGSKDPRDLYDNAENLDEAVNTRTSESWDDRFGVARKTWWGMEQDFQQFLIDSGYENIGDYGPGLEITARNQIFWRDGELYRAGAVLELPYTTTGDWGAEEGMFVAVGDAALRQELAGEGGAGRVGTSLGGLGAVARTVSQKIYEAVSVEDFGAICDGITDSTEAFQKAAEYAKERNVPLVSAGGGGGYVITESIEFYTDTDINAPLVFPADGAFRYIRIKSEKEPDVIPFGQLGGLVEGSSSIAGLPDDASGRFLHIMSDEILTERDNPPGNAPYLKNSAVYVSSENGDISPSLDTTFNPGFDVTVLLFQKEDRAKVKIKSIVSVGEGETNLELVVQRDSVDLHIGGFSIANGDARTLISVAANDCNIYSNNTYGAGNAGLGYGISVGLSCKTGIYGVKTAQGRTSLDGRHGANVTCRDCYFEAAGSHWGNGYVFDNCVVGMYSWAGKDLSIVGGQLRDWLSVRGDVAMAKGRLYISNLTVLGNFLLLWSRTVIAGFFSAPRRFFQEIIIKDIRMLATGLISLVGGGASVNIGANWVLPRRVEVVGVFAPNCSSFYPINLPMDNAHPFSQPSKYFFKNIDLHPSGVVALLVRGPGPGFPVGVHIHIENCGTVTHQVDASAVESSTIINCSVKRLNRVNATYERGRITLVGGTYAPDGASFTESRKCLQNVELIGSVGMGAGADGAVDYQVGCTARAGASGYQTPLNYYVNPSVYITS